MGGRLRGAHGKKGGPFFGLETRRVRVAGRTVGLMPAADPKSPGIRKKSDPY
jgi:hypothetical protein